MAEARIVAIERPRLGHVNIRGDLRDARFAQAVQEVLGAALPAAPNTVVQAREAVLYWLGPDEWLAMTPPAREAAVAAALREALGETFSSVTEVGGGQRSIVLRGEPVRELLARECPLDLDAAVFAPGACAQTRLAKAAVLLRPLAHDAIELVVRRSFLGYVRAWLADAGEEYGFSFRLEEDARP